MMSQEQLSNIYQDIKQLNKYTDEEINSIIKTILDYQGIYVYPRVIKRKLKTTMSDAYDVLDIFLEHGILTLAFEIYCECTKFQNTVYDSISEIPNDLLCEYCYKPIDKYKDPIVIYKVVKHE